MAKLEKLEATIRPSNNFFKPAQRKFAMDKTLPKVSAILEWFSRRQIPTRNPAVQDTQVVLDPLNVDIYIIILQTYTLSIYMHTHTRNICGLSDRLFAMASLFWRQRSLDLKIGNACHVGPTKCFALRYIYNKLVPIWTFAISHEKPKIKTWHIGLQGSSPKPHNPEDLEDFHWALFLAKMEERKV